MPKSAYWMNTSYQIDEIGKMEFLPHLKCFSSLIEVSVAGYSFTIGINTTDQEVAQNLHLYIHSVINKISDFDSQAKVKLKALYNPTQSELDTISVNHIDFYPNKDFDLFYNLPDGSPVEYLSIKFSEDGAIMDSGGGNY